MARGFKRRRERARGGELMRLTRRGRIVRAVAIAAGLALLWWISGHVWYVDEWCIGEMVECVKL
jgi:hypothetical protein